MLKYARLFLIVLLFAACSEEQKPKPTTPLTITTETGEARFMVEMANTPEELKTGLMHRTTLGFTSGMIFNINPARPIAMWMKNTKIPLDMLFIAPDAKIIMIKFSGVVFNMNSFCTEPVRAVVEINAGQVKRQNIKVGDKVNHMLFKSLLDTTENAEPQASKPALAPLPELKLEPAAPQPKTPAPAKTDSAPTATPAEPTSATTAEPESPAAPAEPEVPTAAALENSAPAVPQAPQAPAAPAPKLPVLPPEL